MSVEAFNENGQWRFWKESGEGHCFGGSPGELLWTVTFLPLLAMISLSSSQRYDYCKPNYLTSMCSCEDEKASQNLSHARMGDRYMPVACAVMCSGADRVFGM